MKNNEEAVVMKYFFLKKATSGIRAAWFSRLVMTWSSSLNVKFFVTEKGQIAPKFYYKKPFVVMSALDIVISWEDLSEITEYKLKLHVQVGEGSMPPRTEDKSL